MKNKKAEARARANQTSSLFFHNIMINETKSNKETSKYECQEHWPLMLRISSWSKQTDQNQTSSKKN